ncbi:hypothetical protein [Bacillus licheniformis]|uniref:hypothetical protein n=1 Tax=Bacillus licheniformis TaxID=1402 RepID=UPI0013806B41|nr:hypothetical protein [Bacillus licheniformis]MED4305386.1 hypothetical protein [Bacillus licheniformis]TWL26848.1 hypothetical protein CHCC16874_3238 [Bacillus licheniformis]
MENPNEIKGIQLDNEIFNDYILPKPIVVDGNHRMFAALHLILNTFIVDMEVEKTFLIP